MCASVMFALSMLKAAARLHLQLVQYVLRLPMAFFDTTPVGRLLNRFSKDVDALDNTLPFILRGWITTLLQVQFIFLFFLFFPSLLVTKTSKVTWFRRLAFVCFFLNMELKGFSVYSTEQTEMKKYSSRFYLILNLFDCTISDYVDQ